MLRPTWRRCAEGGAGISVQVNAWKGAWWIFLNHKGQRKAKRTAQERRGTERL
jgi:hypothetical protein